MAFNRSHAGVAQLVEHDVANVVVVGSNPITRSIFTSMAKGKRRLCRNDSLAELVYCLACEY